MAESSPVSAVYAFRFRAERVKETVVRYGDKGAVICLIKCLLYCINKGGTAENVMSFVLFVTRDEGLFLLYKNS